MINKPSQGIGPVDNTNSPVSCLKALPYEAIKINGGFWKLRQTINRQVSLKHGYNKLEEAGNFENLRIAGRREIGGFRGVNFFDEDIYKWLEALGWELANKPDQELHQMADEVIGLIAAAQLPDGYLNSYYQVAEPNGRWTDLDFGHELYCAGHLFQAAIAFQRALGDGRLLEVACRFADHIKSVFGPEKNQGTCGHPEIELALVELYRVTGNKDYLQLAQFFVDQRGKKQMRGMGSNGPVYHQDHVPVREAKEAAGHAVRQMYLLTGIADLFMETGEDALWGVMERLWIDITGSKMYITGGVGSRYDGESFGEPYELPPDQCYCETCAAIGSLMWNWRLLLITGQGRYADIIERTLYNGILSSPALDGRHFFYVNPLMVRSAGGMRQSTNRPDAAVFDGRPEWHSVACCPPNIMRLFSSLGHYVATTDPSGVQVHQYATSEVSFSLTSDRQVKINMHTAYPWEGEINLSINQGDEFPWSLRFRIPDWCHDFSVKVNGEAISELATDGGYVTIERVWSPGDQVTLELSMQPELVFPHPRIDAVRGCVALQRGPIVYCLEAHDQVDQISLLDVVAVNDPEMRLYWREDLLGGIYTIETQGLYTDIEKENGNPYQHQELHSTAKRTKIPLIAIPYYSWGNRGLWSMRVWVPYHS